ncbi:MFS transporter [Kribbella sp. ALI-6-A]|uniref:MFS transporter n=1 Tax=Kribbella sp. ALI-6-A TaxID=1933817 RepID=UPI0022A97C88|nr:MFS transporter [Kribbella sp. ALI-6-A]
MYPLYQLLFTDHGLSSTQISTLFIIWSATAFVLEIPSGALADLFSRRKLLMLGPALTGLGYAAWIAWPSYGAFALGFVLWGAGSALISGTYEAFVYDELAARGSTGKYAGLLGKARSAALLSNLTATLLAIPLFAYGGYLLAGAVSVLSCLAQLLVAASLPEAARVASADETADDLEAADGATGGGWRGALERYLAMLRAGLAEAATSPAVRKAVLLVALLGGFLAFDEYFPLLARGVGASNALVPLLIAGTVAAQAIGGALAGPAYRLAASVFAVGLGATAGLIAWGSLSGTAAGFVPIALGYGVMQLVIVVADARLQDTIEGPARATVTSVSGFFAEVFAVAVYAGFALGAVWVSLPILVAGLTVPVLLTALITPTALPPPPMKEDDRTTGALPGPADSW